MEHTLLLKVPENVYDVLTTTAEQVGRPREVLAVEWLAITIDHLVHDPLEEFIGAFSSNVPNWADDHDYYLGRLIMETMRHTESEAG
jgi:hypothetical protein